MSILNSNSSNFIFNFPKGWWHKSVMDKYDPYVRRMPIPYETVEKYMAYAIQSVTFPTISMDIVTQTRNLGKRQDMKNSTPVQDLFNREVTITFKTTEGHINYFIMLENILCYLNFGHEEMYLDEMYFRALDAEGHVVTTVKYDKVFFKNLSEISLSYSDNNPDFKTFSVTLGFNTMSVFIEAT